MIAQEIGKTRNLLLPKSCPPVFLQQAAYVLHGMHLTIPEQTAVEPYCNDELLDDAWIRSLE